MTTVEQFIADVFQAAAGRQPTLAELAHHAALAAQSRSFDAVIDSITTLPEVRTRFAAVIQAIEHPTAPPAPAPVPAPPVTGLQDAASFEVLTRLTTPMLLPADTEKTLSVRVTNIGTRTWDELQPVPPAPEPRHLSLTYHWTLPDGSPHEWDNNPLGLFPLNSVVRPGESLTVDIRIRAPRRGVGKYVLLWDVQIYQGPPFSQSLTGSPDLTHKLAVSVV